MLVNYSVNPWTTINSPVNGQRCSDEIDVLWQKGEKWRRPEEKVTQEHEHVSEQEGRERRDVVIEEVTPHRAEDGVRGAIHQEERPDGDAVQLKGRFDEGLCH